MVVEYGPPFFGDSFSRGPAFPNHAAFPQGLIGAPVEQEKMTKASGMNQEKSRQRVSKEHHNYTIAWICALPIELTAARVMLDEDHEDLSTNMSDTNSYVLGRIKEHNVVIACLPAVGYGTNNAATVLTHMVRSFPSIRACLMVGIGGAAPKNADVRLGDVVVGVRVMQYDMGKIVKDGEIRRTATWKTPNQLLLKSVSNLRSKNELEGSRIPSILQEKLEYLFEYRRPKSMDCLFAANYDHIPTLDDSCDECHISKLLLRRVRMTENPVVHYGAIASGNQVMRDGTVRDKVSHQLDVICFEMETAGLMDIVPCLPIRGICDYSDSHKNKEWQRYAALAAAAYAKELVELLPVAETLPNARRIVNPTSRDILLERRSLMMESLKSSRMNSRKSTIENAHAQTCQWLLQHPDYAAWHDLQDAAQNFGFLWIKGKPGAGKSTIMKYIYVKSRKGDIPYVSATASFFFNARGDYLEKSITGMYRSLLLQMLEEFPDLQKVFDDPELIADGEYGCPGLNVLKELFGRAISALGQRIFTCFIDALDECDEMQVVDMIQHFESLAEHANSRGIRLRICLSSRHYPYIEIRFGKQVTLEDQPGHAKDLATYVESRLRIRNPELIQELTPKILEKAAGVFLWVVLVVGILNKESRRGGLALRRRFAEIPSDLSKLFRDILGHDNENMEDLRLCISWILCAKRPLTPAEYYHALWSGLALEDLADPDLPDIPIPDFDNRINKYVISSSKGLAEVSKSPQPVVQFIHESIRDFLVKDKGLYELWPDLGLEWESLSHERLKECCNMYLNHSLVHKSVLELRPDSPPDTHVDIFKKYPFLTYATKYILHHANDAADVMPQDGFLSGFGTAEWAGIINLNQGDILCDYTEDASLFYILAHSGLTQLIRARVKRDQIVHIPGERYGYPIFAAMANGHYGAVAALLEWHLDISQQSTPDECLKYSRDLKTCINRTPLSWAAQEGHEDIVRLLLQNRMSVPVDEEDADGQTPLLRATVSGNEEIIRLLITNGADINKANHNGQTSLLCASNKVDLAMAKFLVESGADVNVADNLGRTPLLGSLRFRRYDLARLLIGAGADVNAMDRFGWTPIFRALANGHLGMSRLLLDKGAVMGTRDINGEESLLEALRFNREEFARLLIDRGINNVG